MQTFRDLQHMPRIALYVIRQQIRTVALGPEAARSIVMRIAAENQHQTGRYKSRSMQKPGGGRIGQQSPHASVRFVRIQISA